jgi:glycosidase
VLKDLKPMTWMISKNQQNQTLSVHTAEMELIFSLETGQWLSWRDLINTKQIDFIPNSDLDLLSDGKEYRPPPRREPKYLNAKKVSALGRYLDHQLVDEGLTKLFSITIECDSWIITYLYRLHPFSSLVERMIDVSPSGHKDVVLREIQINHLVDIPDAKQWKLMLPGWDGQIAEQSFQELSSKRDASVIDVPFINIGLIGLHNISWDWNLLTWPFSRTDATDVFVSNDNGVLSVKYRVKMASRLTASETIRFASEFFYFGPGPWDLALSQFQAWYSKSGLVTPSDRPEWARGTTIYEVHIGKAVFRDNFSYTPYPEVSDLIKDLSRIHDLGFETIQIMPHQPYPCYAVHDYYDISTSYGDRNQIRELVETAHHFNMRVILDVLMHGVIDQEIINEVENSILTVPDDYWPELRQTVLDFAPYWREGSLPCHPLSKEHPDWFMQTEDGKVASIYTKAFDLANAEWQEYFICALEFLVKELNIDGFRFDAPNWNTFPDWNPSRPYRASYSTYGSVAMFRKARARLHQLKPDLLLYTESSGPSFRESLDLNYNYDEQWLIPAVMTGKIRSNDMAEWLDQRQKALPPGSITAHHVDSHDTFWWPVPGKKWRREQFGQAATSALIAVLGFIDGAFMNYTGGEYGQELFIKKVIRLRKSIPELAQGDCIYDAVGCDKENVFVAQRNLKGQISIIAVNLTNEETICKLSLPQDYLPDMNGKYIFCDVMTEELDHPSKTGLTSQDFSRIEVTLAPYQACLFVIRLLH